MIPPPAIIASATTNFPAIDPALETAIFKRVKVTRAAIIVARLVDDGIHYDVLQTDGAPKADDRTLFAIDGVTETVTALLLADAVRRGEVRLDEPLSEFRDAALVPPSSPLGALTLVALATHHAGLPAIPLREAAQPYAGIDRAALAALLAAAPKPAASPTYAPSILDYALLGNLLADRAGTSFAALARERVFVPLAMDASVADTGSDARLLAQRSIADVAAEPWRYNALAPAGGVRSSVDDLLRLAGAMFAGENGPLAADMQMAVIPRAAAGDARIGLGWRVSSDGRTAYVSGGSYGSTAFLAVAPKDHTAVVIICNAGISFGNVTFDDVGLRLLADTVKARRP